MSGTSYSFSRIRSYPFLISAARSFAAALIWAGLPRLDNRAIWGAVCVGFAVTTYSTAITYAEVIRVVLIFYLSPAWSKIIEAVFLGRPWRWTSTFTVSGALLGAYLILGADLSFGDFGLGEFMALISGVAWSAGAAFTYDGPGNVDHLTWVTMTDDGPKIAGIALKGIFDRKGLDPEMFGAYDRAPGSGSHEDERRSRRNSEKEPHG